MDHPFRWLLSRRTKEPKLKTIRELAGELEVSRLFGDGEDDIHFDIRDMWPEDPPSKLFGYYSAEGVRYALEALGIFKLIEAHGFRDFKVGITGDAWSQLLRIWGQAGGKPLLVAEGRFRRGNWTMSAETPLLKSECGNHTFNVVFIDWIALQNPLAGFRRPPHGLGGRDSGGRSGLIDRLQKRQCRRLLSESRKILEGGNFLLKATEKMNQTAPSRHYAIMQKNV